LSARLTSGTFIAECNIDCKCNTIGAWGHGSDTASGLLEIELVDAKSEENAATRIQISTMFWRIQSTEGEHATTENLYFESIGRIEQQILDDLGAK